MSKVTIEQLEKSYKETVGQVFGMYLEQVLSGDVVDPDLIDRVSSGMVGYEIEMGNSIRECGGDSDIMKKWFRESLNELKLGDLLCKHIEGDEES